MWLSLLNLFIILCLIFDLSKFGKLKTEILSFVGVRHLKVDKQSIGDLGPYTTTVAILLALEGT